MVELYSLCQIVQCNACYYLFIIYINTKIHTHTHTSLILHTDYIHDKYNIDYVKYKHTHKSKYHLHCNIGKIDIKWGNISVYIQIIVTGEYLMCKAT